MRRFEAIIFDWGNTLVDYPLRAPSEQIAFLKSFLIDHRDRLDGYTRIDVDAAVGDNAWLEVFNSECENFAVRAFGKRMQTLLREDAPEDFVASLEASLCSRIFDAGSVIEGASALLSEARRSGHRVGILSNTPWGTSPETWKAETARYDFVREFCDAIVFCGDVGYRKPHPRAFQYCVQALDTDPAATVMVGDSLRSDVVGAQRCGLSAVWFDRDHSPNPDCVVAVERLVEVAGVLEF